MAETIGSIIDKLIITSLKNHYADTDIKKASTREQCIDLTAELNEYISKALSGQIKKLEFPQNKVYIKTSIEVGSPDPDMTIGDLVTKLIEANHQMWINQEFVYDFKKVPIDKKDEIIERCATLNIERSEFMDAINRWFAERINHGNES